MKSEHAVNRWIGGPTPRVWTVLGIFFFVVLCAFVLTRTKPPFYDEVPHLECAFELSKSVSLRNWLLENDSSAAGPLYAIIHNGFALGGGALPAPWFRLPNLLFLAATILMLTVQLRQLGNANPLACALTALAVPTSWVLSGLALTEIPALFGMTVACWGALTLGSKEESNLGWMIVIAAGVAMATTGRQTYAAALPGVALLTFGCRRNFLLSLVAIGIGLLPLAGLVFVWGGLLPPKLAFMGGGFRVAHVGYAFSYVGLMAFLLAPAYYISRWKIVLPVVITVIAIDICFIGSNFTTLTSAQRFVGRPELMRLIEAGISILFVGAGAAFVSATLLEAWHTCDWKFRAFAAGVFGLCVACGAVVALFSSRYTGMVTCFLVPLLSPWIRFNRIAVLLLCSGAFAGGLALYSYFRFV